MPVFPDWIGRLQVRKLDSRRFLWSTLGACRGCLCLPYFRARGLFSHPDRSIEFVGEVLLMRVFLLATSAVALVMAGCTEILPPEGEGKNVRVPHSDVSDSSSSSGGTSGSSSSSSSGGSSSSSSSSSGASSSSGSGSGDSGSSGSSDDDDDSGSSGSSGGDDGGSDSPGGWSG